MYLITTIYLLDFVRWAAEREETKYFYQNNKFFPKNPKTFLYTIIVTVYIICFCFNPNDSLCYSSVFIILYSYHLDASSFGTVKRLENVFVIFFLSTSHHWFCFNRGLRDITGVYSQ